MLLTLPDDLLRFIFCYLDLVSIAQISRVNKRIATIITEDAWWHAYVNNKTESLYPPRIQLYYRNNVIKPGYERFLPLYVCLCRSVYLQKSCQDYFWRILISPPLPIKQHTEIFFSRWSRYQSLVIRDLLHFLSTQECWNGYRNLLSRFKIALRTQKLLHWTTEDHVNLLIYSGMYELHFPLENINVLRCYPCPLLRSILFSVSTQLNARVMFHLIQRDKPDFLDSKRRMIFRFAAFLTPAIRLIRSFREIPNSLYPSNLHTTQIGEILNYFTYRLDMKPCQWKRWIIKQDMHLVRKNFNMADLGQLDFTPTQLDAVKTWFKWVLEMPSHPKDLLNTCST